MDKQFLIWHVTSEAKMLTKIDFLKEIEIFKGEIVLKRSKLRFMWDFMHCIYFM